MTDRMPNERLLLRVLCGLAFCLGSIATLWMAGAVVSDGRTDFYPLATLAAVAAWTIAAGVAASCPARRWSRRVRRGLVIASAVAAIALVPLLVPALQMAIYHGSTAAAVWLAGSLIVVAALPFLIARIVARE